MLRWLALIVLLIGTTAATPLLAQTASDDASVRQVFTGFESGWNTAGFPGLETLMTPDADFVVVTGKWLKGREATVAYHRNLLKTFYAGSRLSLQDISVRFVDPSHAVAHIASSVTYTDDGKPVSRPSLATATLVKTPVGWRIDTFHNTITGGPGYMFKFAPSLPTPR